MFAPMTSQTEYARFEAETRERTRQAEIEAAPRPSLMSRLAARFAAHPQNGNANAPKTATAEHTAAAC